MSLFIDKKYVSLLGTKLTGFRQKSEFLWNFKCPICGDSQKSKFKMRGYIYRRKSDLFYTCHNCGTSISLGNFLKTVDRSLYREYQMERYKCESAGNVAKPDFSFAMEKPVFEKKLKINLPTIEELDDKHAARGYIRDRQIPQNKWNHIHYAENFSEFVTELLPDYDKKLYDEPRIVLPFYDEKGELIGFQGRAILKSAVKYITIKTSDDNKKVYGLDTIDKSKPVYVVEGPFDSLFLDNAIAMMDASLYNAISIVGNLDYVFIYDNEPRNLDVCRHMLKTIQMGKKICIWPSHIQKKDINEMILTGFKSAQIQSIIDSNTFSDLRAMLEYSKWSKS